MIRMFFIVILSILCMGAVEFDNTDDYLNCGSDTSIDNIFDSGGSVSAWIYATGWGELNHGRITTKGKWNFFVNNADAKKENLEFTVPHSTTAGKWYTTDNTILLNVWHHVVVTYDNGNVTNNPIFYIDGGVSTAVEFQTPVGTRDTDAANNFTVGNNAVDTNKTFAGQIEEIYVYDDILTATEVVLLYSRVRRIGLQISDIISYWALDEHAEGVTSNITYLDMAGVNTCTGSNSPTGRAGIVLSYP